MISMRKGNSMDVIKRYLNTNKTIYENKDEPKRGQNFRTFLGRGIFFHFVGYIREVKCTILLSDILF